MKVAIFASVVLAAATASYAVASHADITPVHEQPAAPELTPGLITLIGKAQEDLAKGDATGAISDLRQTIASPDFLIAPTEWRGGTLVSFVQIETKTFGEAAAFDSLVELGTNTPGLRATPEYQYVLMSAAYDLHKDAVAADTLAALVRADPTLFARLGESGDFTVHDIVDRAWKLKDGTAVSLRLLEALRDTGYHSQNVFWSDEPKWFHLFEAYVATGQDAKARALAATFTEPLTLIQLRADKRYTAYAADGPGRGDFKAALDAHLRDIKDLANAHPRLLEGQVVLATYFVTLNRPNDALKVLDDATAAIKAAPQGQPPYDDLDRQLSWVMDVRHRALRIESTSSDDEARQKATDAQAEADKIAKAKNIDVVSQKINLADTYFEIDQNQKAVDTLADIDLSRASPYGVMAAQEGRVCAYSGLGDKANAKIALDYMKAHEGDSPVLLRDALRCAGDLDGLATFLIANLDDPSTRATTLAELQDYLPSPHTSAFAKRENAKDDQVRARPDVQAAIARYGTIDSYPIYWTPE